MQSHFGSSHESNTSVVSGGIYDDIISDALFTNYSLVLNQIEKAVNIEVKKLMDEWKETVWNTVTHTRAKENI